MAPRILLVEDDPGLQLTLTDRLNREHIPASEIVLRRDFTYNDDQALAKESEESALYRNMRSDAVQQLLRRLQATRLQS